MKVYKMKTNEIRDMIFPGVKLLTVMPTNVPVK